MQVSIPYWRHASNFTRIKYLIIKKLIKQTQAIGPLTGAGRKWTIMYLRSYVLFLKLRENFRDISRNFVNELSYITRLKRLHHVCTHKLRIGRSPTFPLARTVGSTFGILEKRKKKNTNLRNVSRTVRTKISKEWTLFRHEKSRSTCVLSLNIIQV